MDFLLLVFVSSRVNDGCMLHVAGAIQKDTPFFCFLQLSFVYFLDTLYSPNKRCN